jgi:hypothetical protein
MTVIAGLAERHGDGAESAQAVRVQHLVDKSLKRVTVSIMSLVKVLVAYATSSSGESVFLQEPMALRQEWVVQRH